ncbi:MAG: sugar transferase [Verrucomicrobiota bacterium]|jgi:lipopolysaccharide/colanic/teichoic acid biosynthesis glycosyltransferase
MKLSEPKLGTRPKHALDLVLATGGFLFLSPVLGLLAVTVKLSDGGPVFYLQSRVGQHGRVFQIFKFRTMVLNADRLGLSVTRDRDPRITRIGRFLRKTKLDELPQLWNVLRGEMSFVGPRPEVPRYVARYTPEQRQVLVLKPGITDLATLAFRKEEELLATAADTEKFYLEYCVPRKIELNLAYAREANVWKDVKIILRTLIPLKVGLPPGAMAGKSDLRIAN